MEGLRVSVLHKKTLNVCMQTLTDVGEGSEDGVEDEDGVEVKDEDGVEVEDEVGVKHEVGVEDEVGGEDEVKDLEEGPRGIQIVYITIPEKSS